MVRLWCGSSLIPKRGGLHPSSPKDFINVFEKNKKNIGTRYINIDWIPPTSNLCERLFSRAKLVFSERRQRLLPKNLEIVLFLKLNRNLWTPFTVQEVYKDINSTKSSFEHECGDDCACAEADKEVDEVSDDGNSDDDSVEW